MDGRTLIVGGRTPDLVEFSEDQGDGALATNDGNRIELDVRQCQRAASNPRGMVRPFQAAACALDASDVRDGERWDVDVDVRVIAALDPNYVVVCDCLGEIRNPELVVSLTDGHRHALDGQIN